MGWGVVAVTPGSPAQRAGLRQRDLVLQVNGDPVASWAEFYQALWRGKVGDPFELIIRCEEQNLDLVVLGRDRQAFFPSSQQRRQGAK